MRIQEGKNDPQKKKKFKKFTWNAGSGSVSGLNESGSTTRILTSKITFSALDKLYSVQVPPFTIQQQNLIDNAVMPYLESSA